MLRSVSPESRHWRKTQRITALLLAAWLLVTFGASFFARELGTALVGWRFSFWMAAQGAVLIYVLLVWCYARWMARVDREFGLAESE
ncbi:MAG: sodium/substrate symporter small subunit [Burkholderiales bacterium]